MWGGDCNTRRIEEAEAEKQQRKDDTGGDSLHVGFVHADCKQESQRQESRDFTFVDNSARGTVAGLKPLGYEVINLGSDEPIILMDSLRLVEKFVGKKADIVYREMHRADVTETWANITKAKELLDWEPQVSHEEGVRRTVEWYQENREWAKDLLTD